MSRSHPLFSAGTPDGEGLFASLALSLVAVVLAGLLAVTRYRRFAAA